MRLLLRFACNAVALYVAAWALSGVSYGNDWWSLLIAAVVFTVVNMFVKPILTILSLPFIIVTLGLFLFLLNILMLYITDWLTDFDLQLVRSRRPRGDRRERRELGARDAAPGPALSRPARLPPPAVVFRSDAETRARRRHRRPRERARGRLAPRPPPRAPARRASPGCAACPRRVPSATRARRS